MPSAFLIVSSRSALSKELVDTIAHSARRLLPFSPSQHSVHHDEARGLSFQSWSTYEAAARGAYTHEDQAASSLTSFDGWFVEQAPLSHSLARALQDLITRDGFHHTLSTLEGAYTAAHLDADGQVRAARSCSSAQHLYYGQRGDLIAISNRAMLVATALERGGAPRLDKWFFAWWASTNMAPLDFTPSPWQGVKSLPTHTMLLWRDHELHLRPLARPRPYACWEEARQDHITRCNVWTRLPGVRARLPLTGGKDSRAILAALIAANTHHDLDHAYIRAPHDHPDAILAREITDICKIPLKFDDFSPFLEQPLRRHLATHLHRTEARLHPWDVKSVDPPERCFSLGGHFGELYRSHVSSHLLLSWPGVHLLLAAPEQLDKFGCLSEESIAMLGAHTRAWINLKRRRGLPVRAARDHWHREARMWQWATDAMRADSVESVTCTPLVSGRQVASYDAQSLLEQRAERTHFEWMQVGPEWLWRHRFAGATWRVELTPWSRRPPTKGLPSSSMWPHQTRQYLMWQADQKELIDFLCEPCAGSPFQDVFSMEKVRLAVQRYLDGDAQGTPDQLLLKGLFGVLGAKVLMDGDPGELTSMR